MELLSEGIGGPVSAEKQSLSVVKDDDKLKHMGHGCPVSLSLGVLKDNDNAEAYRTSVALFL